MPRNTNTGAVLEGMILPSLVRGGYHYRQQVNIGTRLGSANRRHMLDALAWTDEGAAHLVSLKWQQVSGTAEQKVPFEVMCLASALDTNWDSLAEVECVHCHSLQRLSPRKDSVRVHLVLGGEGWTLRDFYVGGGLHAYMPLSAAIDITTLEGFVARANYSKL